MSRQDQRVDGEGTAIQGGRDVTVNYGPTAEQFSQLMIETAKQLATFHAEGQQKVEERLRRFREEMLREFEEGRGAAAEALKDPDFQAVLGDAQKNFVRTDDPDVAASVINLIAERSQQVQRSRVSLSLNAAVEVLGSLTGEDIATLTALFHTGRSLVVTPDPAQVFSYLKVHAGPLAEMLPANSGSLDYLVSKGCLTFNQFASSEYLEIIRAAYANTFAEDFDTQALAEAVDGLHPHRALQLLTPTFAPNPFSRDGIFSLGVAARYRFKGRDPAAVRQSAQGLGLVDFAAAIESFAESRRWSTERLASELFKAAPELERLSETWKVARMGNYNLTPVGIAIAYSNTRRLAPGYQAQLSIWIS